jgi:carboxypeptidase C (cathepsin A)
MSQVARTMTTTARNIVGALALASALSLGAAVWAPASAQDADAAHAEAGNGKQGSDKQGEKPAAKSERPKLPADATTRHAVPLAGKTLNFNATAGTIKLTDPESGAPRADLAYIAFKMADADPKTRPVAFVFNGGPGYASAWLNLGALGPWRLPMDADAARPSASAAVSDNPQSWLDFTDLVFLDPPGTGYSRVTGDKDAQKSFYSVGGDIDALAAGIRRWSEANDRMLSPKFIVGESYGGFRAPKIAHKLQVEQGVGINGLVLLSPVLDFGSFFASNSVLGLSARLPAMAATVRERKGPITRESMKDVEDYATGAFINDLMKGPNDEQAVARVSAKVAELTGLDAALVRSLGGRVPLSTFAREVNRAEKRVSSMYDGNLTGLDPAPFATHSYADDQLRLGLHAPLIQAMVDLYHRRLNWNVEQGRYLFFNEAANNQWDFGKKPPEAVHDLQNALALDPGLRVLVAHGLTDLVTPYFESKLVLDQIPQTGAPGRLKLQVYPGGHMMYSRDSSRQALHDDARALFEGK